MIIGTFRKTDGNIFEGQVHTFGLIAKLILKPLPEPGENGPHYRAVFQGTELEAGAGWKKESKAGNRYLSVQLDGPTFDRPIYAALNKSTGDQYVLNWSRARRKDNGAGNDEL